MAAVPFGGVRYANQSHFAGVREFGGMMASGLTSGLNWFTDFTGQGGLGGTFGITNPAAGAAVNVAEMTLGGMVMMNAMNEEWQQNSVGNGTAENDAQNVFSAANGMGLLVHAGAQLINNVGKFVLTTKFWPKEGMGKLGLGMTITSHLLAAHVFKPAMYKYVVDTLYSYGTRTTGGTEMYKDVQAFTDKTKSRSSSAADIGFVAILNYLQGMSFGEAVSKAGTEMSGLSSAAAEKSFRMKRAIERTTKEFTGELIDDIIRQGFGSTGTIINGVRKVAKVYNDMDFAEQDQQAKFGSTLPDFMKPMFGGYKHYKVAEDGSNAFKKPYPNEQGMPGKDQYTRKNTTDSSVNDTERDQYYANRSGTNRTTAGISTGSSRGTNTNDFFNLFITAGLTSGVLGGLYAWENHKRNTKLAVSGTTTMVEKASFNRNFDPSSDIVTNIDVMTQAANAASSRTAIDYTEGNTAGAVNTDGLTVQSEKIYKTFMENLAKQRTLALPIQQIDFEQVAAVNAVSRNFAPAHDFNSSNPNSLSNQAGAYIRNRLHLTPSVPNFSYGQGARRFNQGVMQRKKMMKRSYRINK